jgi:hypothetical protein
MRIEFWASLVGAIGVAFLVALYAPGAPSEKVVYAMEYGGLVITFLFAFMILAGIASGKIDISKILEEKNGGGASMSRFQLLILTFVVAISLFQIVVSTGEFPAVIPSGVLTMLGIGATTYTVTKAMRDDGSDGDDGSNGNQAALADSAATPTPGAVTDPERQLAAERLRFSKEGPKPTKPPWAKKSSPDAENPQ